LGCPSELMCRVDRRPEQPHHGRDLARVAAMPGLTRSIAMIASAAALCGGLLSPCASAQTVTIEQYQHPKSEKEFSFNRPYLEGIKDGLIAYNISREDRLFCLGGDPPVLTFERANDILMRWARKRGGDAAGMPLGLAMLYSLKEAFPCKNPPR
jgi:hypothetical protein